MIAHYDSVHTFLQGDCLDDLAYVIMKEISKLSYRVSDADVTRARNQVFLLFWVFCENYC